MYFCFLCGRTEDLKEALGGTAYVCKDQKKCVAQQKVNSLIKKVNKYERFKRKR